MPQVFKMPAISEEDISESRDKFVSGPQHLLAVLDAMLDPAGSPTASSVTRSYLWLAFCGVQHKRVYQLTRDDIDFGSLNIRVGGLEFPIYREALPDLRTVAETDRFLVENPIYTVRSLRDRYDSDQLLRGFSPCDRPKMTSMLRKAGANYQSVFGRKFRMNYKTILHSGIFFRSYELERFGNPVSFKDAVALYSGDDVLDKDPYNVRQRENALERRLKVEYHIWKQLYAGK